MTLLAHGLFSSLCHLFRKGVFSIFEDVSDTSCTVATEDKSEEFAYHVIVKPTFLYVHITFCTGMYAFLYTAFANFAP